MKQSKMFTLLTAAGMATLVACNNTADSTTSADSPGINSTTGNVTSTSDNSAYADEIEKNSAEGRYINPKTGKPYGKLTVNRTTGEITDGGNEPVWRYVDNRNWWVYGVDDDWNWIKLGEARMDGDHLMYKDESGNWVTYEQRWPDNDATINKSWKAKSGEAKIKFSKDGDIKYKDDTTRIKYDADDNRLKSDTSR